MGTFVSEFPSSLSAAYFTLGCKLNFAETATISSRLKERGVEESAPGADPDIVVINTCSVTETADKKARSLIRRIVRRYPQAHVVVTGCYAQLKPEEIAAIPGVNLVVGSKDKLRLPDFILESLTSGITGIHAEAFSDSDDFSPSCSRGDRTRFFLKVQDGCDYFCTYCTIPFARGRSRSGTIADIVAQARDAALRGGREIVITGVNIGDFGKNTGESFFDLLRALDGVEGISRFRISSIEPNLLTDEIIRWIAGESRAFMPHFHIPLQSGSDTVLRKMNRRYLTSLFADRIALIRHLMPDAFIGVDVIAGARGETDEEWLRALEFIRGLDVSRLHVFPYSERPGTAALHLDHVVGRGERNRRTAALIELSDSKLRAFMQASVGAVRNVLWEHPVRGTDLMSGLTDNYLRVTAPLRESLLNDISPVTLTGIDTSRVETMNGVHI